MSEPLMYDEPHVVISRTLGRRHNNPLGEDMFPLLRELLPEEPRVLDVGCGRGASSLWWAAHTWARVMALDLSPAMLEEALREASRAGLADRIDFALTPLQELPLKECFDLILFHDVLCYEPDKIDTLARAISLLAPGGIVSLTDYHASDLSHPAVARVVESWGIVPPPDLPSYRRVLGTPGFEPLSIVDTTGQYRAHWEQVGQKLRAHETDLLRTVGREATERFSAQVEAIGGVVQSGRFGHFWAVLRRPRD